jgi:hypothetical protein
MSIYYFDLKDGVKVRDTAGLEFPSRADAIKHSKMLAQRLSHDPRRKEPISVIVVIDESGAEVHREAVSPDSP